MNIERDAPSNAHNDSPVEAKDADRIRSLLKMGGLSQRAAAKLLKIEERTMREWCAGQGKPPAWVFRALSPRLTHLENLYRMIESNEQRIEAFQDGRIVGLGYGTVNDPRSVAIEIDHLRKQNEQHRALAQWEEAFEEHQEAFFQLNSQMLPHGSGVLSEDVLSTVDVAREKLRIARLEVDRILEEIRAGKR